MIVAIENAILARIKVASDAGVLGYRFHSYETYPEDWDAYLAEKKGLIRAPAVWVVFAGWGVPEVPGARPRLPGTFGLVVMAENSRNEQATRHGGVDPAREPGSYQLIEDMVGLFAGQSLGLDVDSIFIGACRHVRPFAALKDRKVSMLSLELRTAFAVNDASHFDPDLGDFATWHVNWDIPALGGIGPALPDDARADAIDHLTLETLP